MLTQFLAVGTNQLRAAAFSVMLSPSRLVAFGTFPLAWSVFSAEVLVNSWSQAAPAVLLAPIGTARLEPPRKPGIGCPGVWLGITNCFDTFVYLPRRCST